MELRGTGGVAALRASAPRLVKAFLQRAELQLAAFIEKQMEEEGGNARAAGRIGAVTGTLSRALIPNQFGHVGRYDVPGGDGLRSKIAGLEYGIDAAKIPYAPVHEYGASITVTPKMVAFFWAKYRETGSDRWKWMALGAKRKGVIVIPARPYWEPGVAEFESKGLPVLASKLRGDLVAAFNGAL